MICHRSFALLFPDDEWCCVTFHIRVDHLYVFFEKCLFRSFADYLLLRCLCYTVLCWLQMYSTGVQQLPILLWLLSANVERCSRNTDCILHAVLLSHDQLTLWLWITGPLHPSRPSPHHPQFLSLGNHESLLSMFESNALLVLLFCFLLYSINDWNHTVFVFLLLAYFTEYKSL